MGIKLMVLRLDEPSSSTSGQEPSSPTSGCPPPQDGRRRSRPPPQLPGNLWIRRPPDQPPEYRAIQIFLMEWDITENLEFGNIIMWVKKIGLVAKP